MTDTVDNEYWRPLLQELPEVPSRETIQDRATSLFNILKTKPDLVQDIVGEIITQSHRYPRRTDAILLVYSELAKLCKGEKSIKEYGFEGDMALHKALDAELLEMSQTAGEPIDNYHPYDVNCPIAPDETTEAATQKVIKFGKARRHWMIVYVLNGRSRALGLGQEAHVKISVEEEFCMNMIRGGLGLDERVTTSDESNLLGALLIILSVGRTLKAAATTDLSKEYFVQIRKALDTRLRSEASFRLKYFLAHAIESLEAGGEEWSSARIFNEFTWVH